MNKIPVPEMLAILYPRRCFLDAVTVTGGEPLLHKGLPDFLSELKNMSYKVKLDTNASRTNALKYLFDKNLVDYLSVQIVAPYHKYQEVTGYRIKPETIRNAIQLVRRSNIDHEFTITPVPGIHSLDDVHQIAKALAGSRRLVIRRFHPEKSMDKLCKTVKPYSLEELEKIRLIMSPYFNETLIES